MSLNRRSMLQDSPFDQITLRWARAVAGVCGDLDIRFSHDEVPDIRPLHTGAGGHDQDIPSPQAEIAEITKDSGGSLRMIRISGFVDVNINRRVSDSI